MARAAALLLLVVLLSALTGCAVPEKPAQPEAPAQSDLPVAPYPIAQNTPTDIEQALDVALSAVPSGVTRDYLRRPEGKRDQVPSRWWDTHKEPPYKVVEFLNTKDMGPNDARRNVVTVVQERQGDPWRVLPGFDTPTP